MCVAQDFSQALMVARAWVCRQSVCCQSVCMLSVCLSVCLSFSLICYIFLPLEGCDPGMYLGLNDTCLPCPANSNSTQSGASVCPCFEGYYRAVGERPEMACTCKLFYDVSRACSAYIWCLVWGRIRNCRRANLASPKTLRLGGLVGVAPIGSLAGLTHCRKIDDSNLETTSTLACVACTTCLVSWICSPLLC